MEQDRMKSQLRRFFSESRPSSKKEEAPMMKTTFDQLLAKTEVDFKSVLKLYFQYFVIFITHGFLFFYLPIQGNLKYTLKSYCDPDETGEDTCNAFNQNPYIIVFYVLSGVYLWISALQVRDGLPEVMHHYFMMGRYHWFNKLIFNIFMNIPFIFELRVFIDWTYTKTSLDVF